MNAHAPIRLLDRLRICADLWSVANDASPAALGRLAINDSSYFNRTESPRGTTTATLEKFARFLIDPEQWPEGAVPDAVRDFAHVVGVNAAGGYTSPDTGADDIEDSQPVPAAAFPGGRAAGAEAGGRGTAVSGGGLAE